MRVWKLMAYADDKTEVLGENTFRSATAVGQ